MTEKAELKIGGEPVKLCKAKRMVGIRPRSDMRRMFDDALQSDVSVGKLKRKVHLGSFDIVELLDEDADAWLDKRRAGTDVDVGTHVFHTSDDGVPFVPTGEIYIEFDPSLDAESESALLAKYQLEVIEARDGHNFVARVTSGSRNPVATAEALAREARVQVAEPDLATLPRKFDGRTDNDRLFATQWHLQNTGFHNGTSTGFRAGADARVAQAWSVLPHHGHPSIAIAVIDDGYDLRHPDLLGRVVAQHCFTRNSSDVSPDIGDWHGTACAGVAVAARKGGAVVGAAPDCSLVAVRWGRDLSSREVERWFDYVTRSGAAVCSNSWGAAARYFPLSTRIRAAISRCARSGRNGRGCLVVFAAGNEARDIDDPANGSLNGFATHPDVVTVAATTSMDEQAHYSNYGRQILISAPSSGRGGWGIVTTDVMGEVVLPDGRRIPAGYDEGDYTLHPDRRFGGTSSACPLVAGIAALVLAANPELTAADLRRVLAETARPLADQAGQHDPRYGYGCVDAHRAVLAASKLPGAWSMLTAEAQSETADT